MTPGVLDTNVLVYRFDSSSPAKQRRAVDLLRRGAEEGSLAIPFQALAEFVAVTSRPRRDAPPLLPRPDVFQEADAFRRQFRVLWPDERVMAAATRGAAVYGFAWYDALIWAYAERFGFETLYSEDFGDGRSFGGVTVVNPFR